MPRKRYYETQIAPMDYDCACCGRYKRNARSYWVKHTVPGQCIAWCGWCIWWRKVKSFFGIRAKNEG